MPSTSLQTSPQQLTDRASAAALIRQLLSGFPSLDCHDPDGYIAGLVTIACRWPPEDVTCVVETSFQFPPTRFEFNKAIERAFWRRLPRATTSYTEIEPSREDRPTLEELQQQCLEVGIDIRPKPPGTNYLTAEQMREKHGLTREQWDAIPPTNAVTNG